MFNKANWPACTTKLEKCFRFIPAMSSNYERFVGLVINNAKKTITTGYRKEYIPGWSNTSEILYPEFLESAEQEIVDELLHNLDAARRQKWMETVEALDFKQSSRKACSLLRKLGSSNVLIRDNPTVTPNAVVTHIISSSRAPRDHEHSTQVERDFKRLKAATDSQLEYSRPFTYGDIIRGTRGCHAKQSSRFRWHAPGVSDKSRKKCP